MLNVGDDVLVRNDGQFHLGEVVAVGADGYRCRFDGREYVVPAHAVERANPSLVQDLRAKGFRCQLPNHSWLAGWFGSQEVAVGA